jgi:Entner-Doudoroff aldolase
MTTKRQDIESLRKALADFPVIAILRGVSPSDAVGIGHALISEGINVIEVPLNSPEPFASIDLLVREFGDQALIGAGTVTKVSEVERLAELGAKICVSPNCDRDVIAAAIAHGILALPGIRTATEAFVAVLAGAGALKMFPAGGNEHDLSAMRAVLDRDLPIVAVGNVDEKNIIGLRQAGAAFFGVGSTLYRPGDNATKVKEAAKKLSSAFRSESQKSVHGAKLLANTGLQIGESPLVDKLNNRILIAAPLDGGICCVNPETGQNQTLSLKWPIWSLARHCDGRIAALSEDAVVWFDQATGRLAPIADLPLSSGCRANDMAIDRHGHAWVGTMHRGVLAGSGELLRIDLQSGALIDRFSGLGVPNGIASLEGRNEVYVVDTLARTLLRFNPDGTSIGQPAIVTDFMGVPGKPDGMCADTDGNLWVAMWGGGGAVQIDPQTGLGKQFVNVPPSNVSSVAVDQDKLYLTTSAMRDSSTNNDAGGLFVAKI